MYQSKHTVSKFISVSAQKACIAHKSSRIRERCRLRQRSTPATPDHSAAFWSAWEMRPYQTGGTLPVEDREIIAGSRLRVESQKCSCSAACTPPDLIWLRRISDMQQQAEHQVAPKETGKLCGHFNGIAFEEAE
jgi:hypothetical protein